MGGKFKTPMSAERKPLHTLLPLEQPLSLFIDPSDVCNFKCNFCFQHYQKIEKNILTMDIFEKIVRDMKEFSAPFKAVHLNGFGEPLLNQNIVEFVRILKKGKLAEKIEITTNGSKLTKELAEQLVDAGLDQIIFSIYGLDNQAYQKFSSAEVAFEDIYNNIAYLYSIRKECHLHAKIAGEYFTKQEQKQFVERFESIVDSYYIDHAINAWPGLKVTNNEKDHMYNIFLSDEKKVCPMPFYQMVIHSDGKVSPCCVDYKKGVCVGDITQNSLKEIWNGDKYRKLRQDLLENQSMVGLACEACGYPNCGATVDITAYRQELLEKYRGINK